LNRSIRPYIAGAPLFRGVNIQVCLPGEYPVTSGALVFTDMHLKIQ